MTNFFNASKEDSRDAASNERFESGVVLSTSDTDDSLSPHSVKLSTDHSGQIEAEVLVNGGGDYFLPPQGSIVSVAYYADGTPFVADCHYLNVGDDYPEGVRRIGHPLSSAHVLFDENGDVTIENDDGYTIEMNSGVISIE